MLAKMIDKIVSLKETKTFEIGGQTYADGITSPASRPTSTAPTAISVSGLDGVCKLIRTELEKVGTTIMVQAKSNDTVEVMTTYLPDFSRNIALPRRGRRPGPVHRLPEAARSALIELRSLLHPQRGHGLPARPARAG